MPSNELSISFMKDVIEGIPLVSHVDQTTLGRWSLRLPTKPTNTTFSTPFPSEKDTHHYLSFVATLGRKKPQARHCQ